MADLDEGGGGVPSSFRSPSSKLTPGNFKAVLFTLLAASLSLLFPHQKRKVKIIHPPPSPEITQPKFSEYDVYAYIHGLSLQIQNEPSSPSDLSFSPLTMIATLALEELTELAEKGNKEGALEVYRHLAYSLDWFDEFCRLKPEWFELARVPTEGKLVAVFLKVFAADIVPRAIDTALEQREKRFAMVGADNCAVRFFGGVFIFRMVHGRMRLELFAGNFVAGMFVGANHGFLVHALALGRAELAAADVGNQARPHFAALLDQGHHRSLARRFPLPVGFAADKSYATSTTPFNFSSPWNHHQKQSGCGAP